MKRDIETCERVWQEEADASCYLKSFDFDKLLEPVDDKELVIFVVDGDVARVEPSVAVDRLAGGLLVVVVTFHDLGTRDAQLAFLIGSQRLARVNIDDFGQRSGHDFPTGADFIVLDGAHVRHRRAFRHPEPFLQDATVQIEPIHQLGGSSSAQRCSSAADGVQPVESVLLPVLVVSQERHQRRDQVEHSRLQTNMKHKRGNNASFLG